MYLPNVPDIFLGDTAVDRIYQGEDQVWPAVPFEEDWTTLKILSGGTIHFQSESCYAGQTSNYVALDYNVNGSGWTSIGLATTINVSAGDEVKLRADYYDRDRTDMLSGYDYAPSLSGSTALFDVYGNSLSMIYGTNFSGQTTADDTYPYAFAFFLKGTNAVSAENWILPDNQQYYAKWFNETFTLAVMLTHSPLFKCIAVSDSCFDWTFLGASSLQTIRVPYITSIPDTGFKVWVSGVPNTGNFYKKSGVSWTYRDSEFIYHDQGDCGIPSGWTITEV